MCRFMKSLAFGGILFVGACTLDSWGIAFGPTILSEGNVIGVDLEFTNGFDIVVPLIKF